MPRLRLVPLSLWSSRPQPSDPVFFRDERLSPELWGIVIDFVLDEIRHPYRYCTPTTFPHYQARFSLIDKQDKDSTLDDWKSIRLVCRTWRGLARSEPHINLRPVPSDRTKAEVLNGASSVIIRTGNTPQTKLRTLLLHTARSSNLTTVAFSSDCHQDGAAILLNNPSEFPNVRCLSLLSTSGIRPFWQALQDGYPQLVSLAIRYYRGEEMGHYMFKYLESLDINLWTSFRLSCPSLKHFAFHYACTEPMVEFLKEHGHHLQSLFLNRQSLKALKTPEKDIWSWFPNLQTLGRQIVTPFPPPPPGHPLQNLRVLSYYRSLATGSVLEALRTLPGVKCVYICPTDLDTESTDDLRVQCTERNVEVVDVIGYGKISILPLPSSRSWMSLALNSLVGSACTSLYYDGDRRR
ncbi:hypothetical protein FRC20_011071 [Serendipita sp. 405]|nr:hypothetical protein FRC15_006132 [Serendipita sp. 397]KAG8862693.1 hypothetical protein FRC20_011071 [Serendipita sp. 405]